MKKLIILILFWSVSSIAWKGDKLIKPSDAELAKKLDSVQYNVTQHSGTESPFHNKYYNNEDAGIYVDIVLGEPLFSSLDKFDSGTGWPSFSKPLVTDNIIRKENHEFGEARIEVRSKYSNSHLGHVFNDGPKPTGLRYCINSASLKFIAVKDLVKLGYGEFASYFNSK